MHKFKVYLIIHWTTAIIQVLLALFLTINHKLEVFLKVGKIFWRKYDQLLYNRKWHLRSRWKWIIWLQPSHLPLKEQIPNIYPMLIIRRDRYNNRGFPLHKTAHFEYEKTLDISIWSVSGLTVANPYLSRNHFEPNSREDCSRKLRKEQMQILSSKIVTDFAQFLIFFELCYRNTAKPVG